MFSLLVEVIEDRRHDDQKQCARQQKATRIANVLAAQGDTNCSYAYAPTQNVSHVLHYTNSFGGRGIG
jgi:hypothetical protein